MVAARSLIRIAVNVVLDGGLAAVSVPLARWIADPAGALAHPWWLMPLGATCLLLAGLPFRLSLQYWRFAGISDLITVAASSTVAAALFACVLAVAPTGVPDLPSANPAFPLVHGLALILLLGAPRV